MSVKEFPNLSATLFSGSQQPEDEHPTEDIEPGDIVQEDPDSEGGAIVTKAEDVFGIPPKEASSMMDVIVSEDAIEALAEDLSDDITPEIVDKQIKESALLQAKEKKGPKGPAKKGGRFKKGEETSTGFLDYKTITSFSGLANNTPTIDSFNYYSSGALAIDNTTPGGYPSPLVIEIRSDEGVGKTTAALASAKMCTLVHGEYAVIFDYERGMQYQTLRDQGIPFADLQLTDEEKLEHKTLESKSVKEALSYHNTKVEEKAKRIIESGVAVCWLFWPISFEQAEEIMALLVKKLPRPPKLLIIDSWAAMLPNADLQQAGMMSMGAAGGYFIKKLNTLLSVWGSFCIIINHLRVDVGGMMQQRNRPSYLPPMTKSASDGVLKYIAQLRIDLRKGETYKEKVNVTTMDKEMEVAMAHLVTFLPQKQKMFPPIPCVFPIKYGKGIDNILTLMNLALTYKVATLVGGKYKVNSEWMPMNVTMTKGKEVKTPKFLNGKLGFKTHFATNKDHLKLLVADLKELGALRNTVALMEAYDQYDSETETFTEPTMIGKGVPPISDRR